ncbi:hypothetical protein MTR67_042435 [Solanum verrucosum]|uniref:E3 ubiquitin-protein ligase RMA n=1 Tax=Solanum verrucosum TaxID=315347 RepID=A0AAF0UNG1_SOLVR|nr:hypothetical protein MTR67_042435 [Solanum verrucosum]
MSAVLQLFSDGVLVGVLLVGCLEVGELVVWWSFAGCFSLGDGGLGSGGAEVWFYHWILAWRGWCLRAVSGRFHGCLNDSDEEGTPLEKSKMFDDERESGSYLSRGFECNICLDLANDPVVTLCGHLYCWPCIYKWIQLHSIPSENPSQRHLQCPVCKADVSERSMVPLYGRDQATKTSEVEVQANGMVIPERPGIDSHPPQQLHHRGQSNTTRIGGTTTNMLHPLIGETAYAARVSGNSSPTLYPYPNAHHLVGSTTLRMRRQQLQADDKSLRRVHFFLICCVVLCLILL